MTRRKPKRTKAAKPSKKRSSVSKAAAKRRRGPSHKRVPAEQAKRSSVGAKGPRKRKAPPRVKRASSLHSGSKSKTTFSRKPKTKTEIPNPFAVAALLRAADRERTEAAYRRSRCSCSLHSQKPGPKHDSRCGLYRDHVIDKKRSDAAKLGWKRRKKRERVQVAGDLLKPAIKAMRMERLEWFYEAFEEEWHELADEWDIEDRELYSYLMDSPTEEAA